jgi:hypothetical protein
MNKETKKKKNLKTNKGATTVHSMYVGMVSASRRVHNDTNPNPNSKSSSSNSDGDESKDKKTAATQSATLSSTAHSRSSAPGCSSSSSPAPAAAAASAITSCSSSPSLQLGDEDEPVLARNAAQSRFFVARARTMILLTMSLVYVVYAALGAAGALQHGTHTHINTGVNVVRDLRENAWALTMHIVGGGAATESVSGGGGSQQQHQLSFLFLMAARVALGAAAVGALVYQKLAVLPLIFASVDNMFARASGTT